jgi:hypothetical protein
MSTKAVFTMKLEPDLRDYMGSDAGGGRILR